MTPNILQVGDFPPLMQSRVDARFECLGEDALAANPALAGQVRAILTRSNKAVPEALIERLPNLGLIATCGVGFDLIPVAFARERGIAVSHTPDVLNAAVAEMTVGLLLAMLRHIPAADRYMRAGSWAKAAYPLTASLTGKRVGIAGMGRIGREIARRLAPFDVTLGYYGRRPQDLPWHFESELAGLAAWCDILILMVPGGAATARIANREVFEALGPDGYLLNVARGSVVDEDALIEALRERRIAGAALDVFDDEPDVDPRFLTLDNVVLSPHAGSATHETRAAMIDLTLDNIQAFLAGGKPLTPVP